jgi:outer membrane protein OmpA-like peptidoglycan-associated protein
MNPETWKRSGRAAGILLPSALALLLIAGCGPSRVAKEQLDIARKTYAEAKADPEVATLAPVQLAEAERAVREAEQAGRSSDMLHLGYLAEQKSRIAMTVAEGKVAERDTQKLTTETAELIAQKQRLDRQRELEKRQALTEAERARLAAEQARLAAEQARLEAEQARLAARTEAERATAAEKEAEAARLAALADAERAARAKADADALMQELSELKAQQTERGIVLTMGEVLFAFAKADLSTGAHRSVSRLAAFLQKYPNRSVLIEGHTDSVGSDEYNLDLSRRRAESVKARLVMDGVEPGRITTVGYGKRFPAFSNDTAANRAMNRRVEVVILHEGVDPKSQLRE